jgi:hypothetical protein
LQYANQNFGVRPATVPTTAAQLQSYAPPPMVQPWNMASNQAAPVGPLPQTGQTGQQNSLTVNPIPVRIYISGCRMWCMFNGFHYQFIHVALHPFSLLRGMSAQIAF